MNGYFTENEDEIIQLILKGEAVCDCGALMNLEDDQFVCPNCGKVYDIGEYEDNGPYINLVDGCILVDSEPDIPSGCVSCGAPYPNCKTSCDRFDD